MGATELKNCTNCKKLAGAQSLDDQHEDCALCVSGHKTLGIYPYWEPVDGVRFLYDTATGQQTPLPKANTPTKTDMVNSPDHYKTGGIETIDYIEAKLSPEEFLGYCIGNSLKYMSRAGKKDKAKTAEDYKKAVWYINRAVKTLEKQ